MNYTLVNHSILNLFSFKNNLRARVKVYIDEGSAIDSLTSVFPCANWFEREAFDLSLIHI